MDLGKKAVAERGLRLDQKAILQYFYNIPQNRSLSSNLTEQDAMDGSRLCIRGEYNQQRCRPVIGQFCPLFRFGNRFCLPKLECCGIFYNV